MICSSNVFFINNPDPNPDSKLRLKPDFKKITKFGSTTLIAVAVVVNVVDPILFFSVPDSDRLWH